MIRVAIENFLFHCRYEKNLSTKTINAYEIDLNQFRLFIEEKKSLCSIEEIGKEHIKDYIQHISYFKQKTVKRKMASLKAMFNYLEYEQDDFNNPFRKIKIRLKEAQTLPTVMTIKEVKTILEFLYNEQNKNKQPEKYQYKAQIRNTAMVELLFGTGIRVSELCGLKAEDVDLKTNRIKVLGKGNKERIIQLCDSELKASLKNYFQMHKREIENSGYFFTNRLKNPISTQSVRIMLKKSIEKIGLSKKITPHTFRHTFATLLLEENVDIRYIQNILGHSTITTTQIYTHVNTAKQKQILMTKHPRRKFSLNPRE